MQLQVIVQAVWASVVKTPCNATSHKQGPLSTPTLSLPPPPPTRPRAPLPPLLVPHFLMPGVAEPQQCSLVIVPLNNALEIPCA